MKKNIQSSILVAVDMGSQTFRAMAGEIDSTGLLRVLGVEESSQKCCVHHGVIENTGDAGYMLTSIIKLLGNRIGRELSGPVFVCVGGKTLQVVSLCSKRDWGRKRLIDAEVLVNMETECYDKVKNNYPGWVVLDLIPSHYVLDDKEQDDEPKPNQTAVLFDAYFNAFVGKEELKEKVKKTFDQTSSLCLEKMYTRPEALVNALANDDMEEGCAVLDLGAQTSTLTIHKAGEYLHNEVLPRGGLDITKAIKQLGVSLSQAERLKCLGGVASATMVKANRQYSITSVDGDKVVISSLQLANIISACLDDMLAPLMEILNKEADRLKVLYVTGAGAMLKGVAEYIQSKTSVKVMYGSHASWLTTDTPNHYCLPQYASLVGTLLLGAEWRKSHVPVPNYHKNKPIIEIIKEKTLELFMDTNKV